MKIFVVQRSRGKSEIQISFLECVPSFLRVVTKSSKNVKEK